MLFKFDENLSPSWADLLQTSGHAVASATDEGLKGADDHELIEAARREGRCLVTADEDFAQLIDYPAERYAGIIVLRHARLSLAGTKRLVEQLAVALEKESPVGRLWIVEPGRIRIHESD
jgi:predicted nuclease of predicted toxin-antitoxin system